MAKLIENLKNVKGYWVAILAVITLGETSYMTYDKYFGNTNDEDIVEIFRQLDIVFNQLKGEGDPDKNYKDNHRVDLIHANVDRYNTPKASFTIIEGERFIANFDRSLGAWVYKDKSNQWLTIPKE